MTSTGFNPNPPASAGDGKGKMNPGELNSSPSDSKPAFASNSPAALALPVSGGAIRPISENFSVNSVTGTCSLTIPIALSSSRPGPLAKPNLDISYDSGAGNGTFGYGWRVNSEAIDRKTSKGLPKFEDGDVFLLSGIDLVPKMITDGNGVNSFVDVQQDSYMVRRYFHRVETTFDRIERWTSITDPSDVHWRKITGDNVTHVFGNTMDSRIMDPYDKFKIFSWLLSSSWDTVGNAIIYNYKTENSEGVIQDSAHELSRNDTTRSSSRYLKTVKYGNIVPNRSEQWLATDPFALPDGTWMFSVVLDYGEHDWSQDEVRPWVCRQDPFSTYKSTFELRTYRICQRILIFHHIGSVQPQNSSYLVRSVSFDYLSTTSSTFLASVTQSGHFQQPDLSYSTKSLPKFSFEYTSAAAIESWKTETASTLIQGPPIRPNETSQWLDLNGEGIPGLLCRNGGKWFYRRNLGPSVDRQPRLSEPVELKLQALGTEFDEFIDIDGSGTPSIVYSQDSGTYGFHGRRGLDSWDEYQPFLSRPLLPQVRRDDLKYLDLTGDGLADMLLAGDSSFTWAKSLGRKGYGNIESTFVGGADGASQSLIFSDITQSVFQSDMSGDGLTDLVLVRNGYVAYWPNLGYGRFGSKILMDDSPWMESQDQYSPNRLKLVDIDGNGLTDILYLSLTGDCHIFRNQSGNSWGPLETVSLFSPISQASGVDVVDLFGTGTTCLVWTTVLPDQTSQLSFVDLTGGVKPSLLQSYDNGMGLEVQMTYEPSTKFFLEDESAGTPWATRLPFPVQCLVGTESFDKHSMSRLSKTFAYHHGFFDPIDREFRGFGLVEEWDSTAIDIKDTAGSKDWTASMIIAPTLTKSWFHTGVYFSQDELLRQYSVDYAMPSSLEDGDLIPESTSGEEVREASRALAGQQMRQEIYAVDGTSKSAIPVQVSEALFQLDLLQHRVSETCQAVFAVAPRESVAIHLEQDSSDPRIQHSIALEVDNFGNVLKSIEIAYGRNKKPADDAATTTQKETRIVYTESSFTNMVDSPQSFRLPIKYESQSFEALAASLPKPAALYAFSELQKIISLPVAAYDTGHDQLAGLRRQLDHSAIQFRGADLNMLDLGLIDEMALPGQSFKLAMVKGDIDSYPKSDPSVEVDFRAASGMIDFANDGSFWVPSGTQLYTKDASSSLSLELQTARSNFFVPRMFLDAFKNSKLIEYDDYNLLPVSTTDAINNVTLVVNDYRVLQSSLLTDINGNNVSACFDELGVAVGTAVMGKPSDSLPLNDLQNFSASPEIALLDSFFTQPTLSLAKELLGNASSRIVYDLSRSPAVSATIQRETDKSVSESSAYQIVISYVDGTGKKIQDKRLSEISTDGDTASLWLTSGWVVLNNKGLPMRKYEPFFDLDHSFNPHMEGSCTTTFYDPLGRAIGLLEPNGLWNKSIYGPWEIQVFDSGDLVLRDPSLDPDIGPYFKSLPEAAGFEMWHTRTSGDAASKSETYAETPTVTFLDALGNSFLSTTSDKNGNSRISQVLLDIQGHTLAVQDSLGRQIAQYRYNMVGQCIHSATMDTGEVWQLYDGAGTEVCKWNSRGIRQRAVLDALRRVDEMHVLTDGSTERMVNKVVFGESRPNSQANNSRGKMYQVFDQSGSLTSEAFDYRGNPLKTSRIVVKAYTSDIDWTSPSSIPMDADSSVTEVFYDALSRVIGQTSSDGSHSSLIYSQNGQLRSVVTVLSGSTAPTTVISDVEYNARGQEIHTTYGNGTSSAREYDVQTFQMTRLRTMGTSTIQDLSYEYDCLNKVIKITDRAQSTIFFRNEVTNPELVYSYDFLGRLVGATGRESVVPGNQLLTPSNQNANAVTSYSELYSYDSADNILSIAHQSSNTSNSWTKNYHYAFQSFLEPTKMGNKLSSTDVGGVSSEYAYDGSIGTQGCPTKMPGFTKLEWDYLDQLQAVSRQIVNDTIIPEITWYVYDMSGKRVRKVTEASRNIGDSPTILKETLYLDGIDVFKKYTQNVVSKSCTILKLQALGRNLVQFESLKVEGKSPMNTLTTRYQVSTHLPSVAIELDENGAVMTYEEYSPYGSTTYSMTTQQLKVPKRYRFSGKELDRESGLVYFGRRYLAVDLGRWISADPIGLHGGTNLFCYVSNDPVNKTDEHGLSEGEEEGKSTSSTPQNEPTTTVNESSRAMTTQPAQQDNQITLARRIVNAVYKKLSPETKERLLPPEIVEHRLIYGIGNGIVLGFIAGKNMFINKYAGGYNSTNGVVSGSVGILKLVAREPGVLLSPNPAALVNLLRVGKGYVALAVFVGGLKYATRRLYGDRTGNWEIINRKDRAPEQEEKAEETETNESDRNPVEDQDPPAAEVGAEHFEGVFKAQIFDPEEYKIYQENFKTMEERDRTRIKYLTRNDYIIKKGL